MYFSTKNINIALLVIGLFIAYVGYRGGVLSPNYYTGMLVIGVAMAAFFAGKLMGYIEGFQEPGPCSFDDLCIKITDDVYMPKGIAYYKKPEGVTISWQNFSSSPQTVTIYDLEYNILNDSGPIKPGDRYSYTFKDQGRYLYRSSNARWLMGEVIIIDFELTPGKQIYSAEYA